MSAPGVMPFRLLIDEAMRRLRPELRRIYPGFAVFFAVTASALVLAQVGWVESLQRGDLGRGCGSGLLYLLILVLYGFGYVALNVVALDVVTGRRIDLVRAWSFPLGLKVIGTLLLVGVLLVLAYVMCLVPILYVMPILSMVVPVMVVEELRGTRALKRSARLIGLNPLAGFPSNPLVKVLALTFVTMVISWAASMISQMPFEIVRQILLLRGAGAAEDPMVALTAPGSLALQFSGAVLGALATTVVSLYSAFALALFFFDLRARREGDDLEAELEALEARRGLAGEPPTLGPGASTVPPASPGPSPEPAG